MSYRAKLPLKCRRSSVQNLDIFGFEGVPEMSAFTATGATQGEVKGLYSKIKKSFTILNLLFLWKKMDVKIKEKKHLETFAVIIKTWKSFIKKEFQFAILLIGNRVIFFDFYSYCHFTKLTSLCYNLFVCLFLLSLEYLLIISKNTGSHK